MKAKTVRYLIIVKILELYHWTSFFQRWKLTKNEVVSLINWHLYHQVSFLKDMIKHFKHLYNNGKYWLPFWCIIYVWTWTSKLFISFQNRIVEQEQEYVQLLIRRIMGGWKWPSSIINLPILRNDRHKARKYSHSFIVHKCSSRT